MAFTVDRSSSGDGVGSRVGGEVGHKDGVGNSSDTGVMSVGSIRMIVGGGCSMCGGGGCESYCCKLMEEIGELWVAIPYSVQIHVNFNYGGGFFALVVGLKLYRSLGLLAGLIPVVQGGALEICKTEGSMEEFPLVGMLIYRLDTYESRA